MFAFFRLSPKSLIIGALLSFLFVTIRNNRDLYLNKELIAKGERVARIDTIKTKLTPRQKDDLDAMAALKERSGHKARLKKSGEEIRAIQGNYHMLSSYQGKKSLHVELYYSFLLTGDILLFMFLGMVFYRNGILSGKAKNKIYWAMCIGGLVPGLILSYFRIQPMIESAFNAFDYSKKVSIDLSELSRALRSIGFLGLLMLLYKSSWFKWLFTLLQPVGQMAFTNYLMQSFICGLIFYGVGFGMFGKLQRYEIYYVAGLVWVIEITWSHIWLKYYRFGPMEWLWRSLTYWEKQPMKIK